MWLGQSILLAMEDYRRTNQAWWDELVDLHAASAFYGLDHFRQGHTSLRSLELREVGDVSGRLLHLQRHFGLDTLLWARPPGPPSGL